MEPETKEPVEGSNVVERIQTSFEPPVESSESVRTRRYIVLSFWLVVVLLGLPIWWKTTEVYRAELPLAAMSAWAEGSVSLATTATDFDAD